ncbi:MAG: SDR family oxidoreductase, partial [Candidatus Thermoplasmatota archaeon]|nr:SDR family oxidoreductase [Candidatus Thermoplasmatota archaeon]
DTIDIVFHCAAKVKDYGPKKEFFDVNVTGTKNLIEACKESNIKQFFYLSHLPYESSSVQSYYSQTKHIAESVLLKEYNETGFPVTIIQPGNVFGPGNTIWVSMPIESIQKNRLFLINKGKGIFLHTYIENLLDAILLCINEPSVIGKTLLITDGDNTITWGTYFNDLAAILEKKEIQKNLSKRTATIIGQLMVNLLAPLGIRPWITPFAVDILTNTKSFDLKETQQLINYVPKVSYTEAMGHIGSWIQKNYRIVK